MYRTMNRLRRAAVLALALLVIPGIASAAFQTTAASSLSVGTATVGTPTNVSFSFNCANGTRTLKLDRFTGVMRADRYRVEVTSDGTRVAKQDIDQPDKKVELPYLPAGELELKITALLGSWTGVPFTSSLDCGGPRASNGASD